MIGILVDTTRCTGCNQCVAACSQANGLADPAAKTWQASAELTANQWAAVIHSPEGRPVRKFCRHCLEPACVSVCPAGAMVKTPEGPVIYDSEKCLGCRYCMMACPYGIPRYEWDSPAPTVQKCNLCYSRLQAGELPVCVDTCTEGVLSFGERDVLLTKAHALLKEKPTRYQPVVYGEREAGGASVLYISDVPLDFLGFQGQPGSQALPELSGNWLGKVPALGFTTAGLMTGLFYIIGRRMQAEEARAARASGEE